MFIYRLLATCTIDEKIFQRQLRKQEVAESVVDEKADISRKFTGEDLMALFVYRESTCETYDLMHSLQPASSSSTGVNRTLMDVPQIKSADSLTNHDWDFFPQLNQVKSLDPCLGEMSSQLVSFIFARKNDFSLKSDFTKPSDNNPSTLSSADSLSDVSQLDLVLNDDDMFL